MSGPAASIEDFRIDADAIIPDAQHKSQLPIGYFCFYILRLSVAERIAQCLTGEAVDFIAENWIKVLCFAFYDDAELRCIAGSRKFLAYRSQSLREVIGDDRGCTQILHCTSRLCERLISLVKNLLERLLCIFRVRRQHVLRSLKIEE
jgi:hypothetical protein